MNILEGLGVGVGTTIENELPDDSTSDVGSFFLNRTNHVAGAGKLGDLSSGISEGPRASYVSAWKHCAQFTQRALEKRWISVIGPKWDETLAGWILFGTRILGIQASTMRPKISGLRYWHLLPGFPDWGKWSGRYKQVLSSVAKKDATCRNYSSNLELMNWIMRDLGAQSFRIHMWKWEAIRRNMSYATR